MSATVPSPAALRRIALDAAGAVSADLAAAFRSPAATGPEAKTTHHDLVTVHDRRTEARLVAALTTAVPGSAVLGEELGARDGAGEAARLTWIVDPVDGTSNFAHGFAMFSVSVAAAVDGEVVAGVVLDPVSGLAFSADDDGAWLARPGVAERPLADVARPAPAGGERAQNLVTSYPAGEALALEGEDALRRFGRLVSAHATVRRTVSGALELAYAAAGWADAALYVDTKPWDVAAGQLILRRAGGRWLTPDPAAPSSGRLVDDGPRAHTCPFALAVAPGREVPTTAAVLGDIVASRAADHV